MLADGTLKAKGKIVGKSKSVIYSFSHVQFQYDIILWGRGVYMYVYTRFLSFSNVGSYPTVQCMTSIDLSVTK